MSYRLFFHQKALKEWKKLPSTIQAQFKKKLKERLIYPVVQGDRLRGTANRYKIKLKSSGYRLVYDLDEDKLVVLIISKRDTVYTLLKKR